MQHEKGNYENWEYSVKYEEALNVFPSARVFIWADYQISPERHGKFAQPFRIKSQHKTCFLLFCCKYQNDYISKHMKSGRLTFNAIF